MTSISAEVLIIFLCCFCLPLIVPQTYECTTAGRFRYYDSTCRSFYICAYYNGAYIKSNYTCPQSKVFDATSQVCSATATCINALCASSTLYSTLSDPNAVNCTSYIICYGSTTLYPEVVTCPSGYYYNSLYGMCTDTANC